MWLGDNKEPWMARSIAVKKLEDALDRDGTSLEILNILEEIKKAHKEMQKND